MPRKMTLEEADERGLALPESNWLSYRTGKPMISREEWEQLGRWRRLRDVLLGQNPGKVSPEYRRPPRRES